MMTTTATTATTATTVQKEDGRKNRKRMTSKSSVRMNIARGYSRLSIIDLAKKEFAVLATERYKKEPPKSFAEVYERLPPSKLFPEPFYPDHLEPVIEKFKVACDEQISLVLHTPPRHGKSQLMRVAFHWYLFNRPGHNHAYLTYNMTKARDSMKAFTDELRHMGIRYNTSDHIVHVDGGARQGGTSILFGSVKSHVTGLDLDGVVFIDDPVAGAKEVRSSVLREKLWAMVNGDVLTRQMKGHLSIICVMTRWHHDDLSGRLIEKNNWEYLRLPAFCDDEENDPIGRRLHEPLCEFMVPMEDLERTMREDPKKFASMYQGLPSPEGNQFFTEDYAMYDYRQPGEVEYAVGIDCAYAGKKSSDWSVLVCLAKHKETGLIYIEDVIRKQCQITDFIKEIIKFYKKRRLNCEMMWDCGPGEQGYVDLMNEKFKNHNVPKLNFKFATQSKDARAYNVAEAWERQEILYPMKTTYSQREFLKSLFKFTGEEQNGVHDDDVDAFASAYSMFEKKKKSWKGSFSNTRPNISSAPDRKCF